MAGYTAEQITRFRTTYNHYATTAFDGIEQGNFAAALRDCMVSVGLAPITADNADEHFRAVRNGNVVGWQAFFQVLIKIRLEPLPPTEALEYRPFQSAPVALQQASSQVPPPESSLSRSRVLGMTLRRGGMAVGRAVGNFLGVTSASQTGYGDTAGWDEAINGRVQSGGSIHPSLLPTSTLRRPNEPPPSYTVATLPNGRSFDPSQLEEDGDDDAFITQAPPDYNVVTVFNTSFSAIPNHQHTEAIQLSPAVQHMQERVESSPDFIYDSNEAYAYYKRFITAENKIRNRRRNYDALEFFGGGADFTQSGDLARSGTVRRGRLQPPRSRPKVTKLERQSTLVRREVNSLPTFWPVCTVIITIAQIATMITLLVLTRPPAPINVKPVGHVGKFSTLTPQPPPTATNTSDNDSFFNNFPTASVMYYRASNLWIGPRPVDLIQYGAKFSPCMRNNTEIGIRNARIYGEKKVCCVNGLNVGIIPQGSCQSRVTTDVSNGTCLNLTSDFLYLTFRPCCLSITGDCNVTSKEECDARKGFFHESASSCDEVNCIRSVCGFNGKFVSNQDGVPYLPAGNQFWRWFTSLFVHLGVLHMVLVIPIQLYVGIKIERTIGWLRIGLIYLISGVGGNILSGIFAPYEVNGGSSAAVLGLVGVLYVELFQFWQIVDRAWLELIKLMAFLVFLLFLGTFPFIDNWAHLGGLLFGVVSGIIFVPYITFGKLDAFRKRVILLISLPLLVLLIAAGFATFYLIGGDFCPYCRYINCIPYTKGLCTTDYADIRGSIPAL